MSLESSDTLDELTPPTINTRQDEFSGLIPMNKEKTSQHPILVPQPQEQPTRSIKTPLPQTGTGHPIPEFMPEPSTDPDKARSLAIRINYRLQSEDLSHTELRYLLQKLVNLTLADK